MTTSEIAERFAESRPGMALVDYVEVGLPAWRVLARCDVLARKPISAIDETVMRAVKLGVDDPVDLQIMLGLDEVVLDSTIITLVAAGWVSDAGDGRIALTDGGLEVLRAAVEIVARELVVPFDYDGLLRRPILNHALVDRRTGRSRGLREVPATPERPPDVGELRRCKQDIVRVMRGLGDGRDQESQLLSIRSLDRRERYVLSAVALIFAPRGKGRCEAALVIDDQLSIEHEAAFTNASLINRLGLDRRLRATPRTKLVSPGPPALRPDVDADAEGAARRELNEALAVADTEGPEASAESLSEARRKLSALSPRTILPHEHRQLLDVAVGLSRHRLVIAGGRASDAHVDARFIGRLRQTLETGALVKIIVEGGVNGQKRALDALLSLSRDFSSLELETRSLSGLNVLLSDSRFVVLGGYPWLGQLGDPERPIADRRSLLTYSSDHINEEWERLDGRTSGTAVHRTTTDSAKRPRRRRRRRKRREGDPRS